jgi:hypothetical protein
MVGEVLLRSKLQNYHLTFWRFYLTGTTVTLIHSPAVFLAPLCLLYQSVGGCTAGEVLLVLV